MCSAYIFLCFHKQVTAIITWSMHSYRCCLHVLVPHSLSLAVRVCACITVDNVAVVVSQSPYTQPEQSRTLHSACPFCAASALTSSRLALPRIALCSHMKFRYVFFYFCIILFMFRTRGFFLRAFNFLTTSRAVPVYPCAVCPRARTIFFFRAPAKGSNLGTARECECV